MLQTVKTLVADHPSKLLVLTQEAPGRPSYPQNCRLLVQHCILSWLVLPLQLATAPSRSPPIPFSSLSGSSCMSELASPPVCASNLKKNPSNISSSGRSRQAHLISLPDRVTGLAGSGGCSRCDMSQLQGFWYSKRHEGLTNKLWEKKPTVGIAKGAGNCQRVYAAVWRDCTAGVERHFPMGPWK